MTRRTKILLIALALLLCTWSFAGSRDPFWMVDLLMKGSPDSVQMAFCVVLIPFMFLQGFSFHVGTAILTLLVWFERMKRLGVHASDLPPLTLPMFSYLWLATQAVVFLSLPRGTPIRPMGWALCVGSASLVLTILSIANTVAQFKKGKNKVKCSIALLASIFVIAVPSLSLHIVAQIRGLVLEP